MKRKALKKALIEYPGTMAEETYSSPKAKMMHEKGESKMMEAKEKALSKIKKRKNAR